MMRRLAAFAENGEDVNVIIETPADSRIKYAWDPDREVMRASKVLAMGLSFPFDFGFVADTKADDGDPYDALVIADAPLAVGSLVECRVLGAMAIRMSEAGSGEMVENDRLIVVPAWTIRGGDWRELDDVGATLLAQIGDFLRSYVEREG